ncbi:MAG: universal stress protein [Deltaproteobacteria bacterium]|nr:universal stress protein [Candidatus Anaeroferrophillus wilburensis]MBN2888127.1 universal stress protein [Deltaproteobacteria bacterium]
MLNYRKKILVAVDGSAVSDKAVYEAVWMAGCGQGAFPNRVVAVFTKVAYATDYFDKLPTGSNPVIAENDDRWQEVVEQIFLVAKKLASENNVLLETKVMFGDPATSIVKVAKDLDVDVIVIGSTGKGMVARTLLGSVSSEVLNHAPCSVYLVKA